MPLSIGDKLGHYEILGPLGAGGMGEVYRARDTQLEREVAIKVLPHAMARDPERLARFDREAKILAALNHPNIAVIYGLVESGGQRALAMELVPGDTLGVRIKRGTMPLQEALNVAKQMAEALEAAHEKGVTHRDLKPGNVMITPAGVVKVLDFGLAAIAPPAPAGNPDNSPTLTMGMTQAGTIMGTASYMSPEQAEGEQVDKRADIWSFGVVLWEMLTSKRLFEGQTVSRTLAAVLQSPIDFDKLAAPAPVKKLLRRCLERDVRNRLRDIGEARVAIQEYVANPQSGTEVPLRAESPPSKTSKLPWAAAAVTSVAAVVGIWAPWRTPPPAPQVERFEIAPPDGNSFDNVLLLSPDGRQLAFNTNVGGTFRGIWVRSLDTLQARQVAPQSGNPAPFWSPDSRFIAFQQDGKLKKVDIAGGPPVSLSDAPVQFGGGAWSEDNIIVFGNRQQGALMQVPAAGGIPAALTKLDEKRGETNHEFPWFLPDRKHFIYLRRGSKPEFTGIYIGTVGVPPEQQNLKLLVATPNSAVYTPSPDPREATRGLGFLLFLREDTLMAQPFDADALELKGEPVPIAEQIASTNYGFGRFAASRNGALVFATGGSGSRSQLTWFDRAGKNLGTIGNPGGYAALSLAPDGSRVAAEKREGDSSDLWLIDAAPGGKNDRFTFDPGRETSPVWSPDGSEIVFAANPGGGVLNLFKKPSNLTGKEVELLKSEQNKTVTDWSRDGKTLSFSPFNPDSDTFTLNLSDKKSTPFVKTEVRDVAGRFSPDGRWLAYSSEITGRQEVYVRPFPANEAGGQQMVSLGGGIRPLWKRDGRELYYEFNGAAMSVEVTPGAALRFGQPKLLFRHGLVPGADGPYYQWDATAEGSRFLINIAGEEASQDAAPLTLVLNWTAALK